MELMASVKLNHIWILFLARAKDKAEDKASSLSIISSCLQVDQISESQ